ncbi:MAG: DegT/DnrJ/EryC1/StrS family aminotransferase [candidate division Zixibacteria bacterium]|nr:DegT/DnrJ/EryC1/StrS family aminotransferase [candidate division Zixibacteria bacterium]
MAVPFLDLSRQYAYLKDELDAAAVRVLSHGQFILGPEVAQLEKEVAALCGVKHALGVASGTDALLLALRAAGVAAGDEVITTDFSFFSTAGVVARLGARPVFVDIEVDSYNLDPTLIEASITPRTKAIMPVHLFGQVADMDAVMEIARRHHLTVIEDAAQAIGAGYKDRRAGAIGDLGCFSFYPTKNLGAAGDAGMITTDSDELYDLCRILRVHGAEPKYYHRVVGYNSRLDTMQAALLLVKLPYLEEWSRKRIEHARVYDEAFAGLSGPRTPVVKDYSTFHIYNQYTIAVPAREELRAALQTAGIGSDIYYPVAFHRQECFQSLGYGVDDFPVAVKASGEVLALPIYPELTAGEQQAVINAVTKFVA